MARGATKAKEQKPIEQTLWDAANKLRGKVEPAEYKHSRMTDADYIKDILDDVSAQLMELLRKLREEQDSFNAMGIDYEEKAFYDILVAVAEKFQFEFPDSENIELAKEIRAALRDKEKYADWANSAQIKALMQADIIIILAKHGYPPTPAEIYEKVYNDILEQTENFKKYSE